MGALYQIEFPNGKSYVGITAGMVAARFKEHVKESAKRKGWALHRALAKYGAGTAAVKTLAIADDWEYLQLIERNAIRVLGTFGPGGYNMTAGGDGFTGAHTPEAKAKIAAAARNCSAETRKKIGDAFRGKTGSNKGAKHSAQACAEKALRQLLAAPSAANTSGHKGVYWSKAARKWQAYIRIDKTYKYLGLFEDIFDAVHARETALQRHLQGATP